MDAVIFIGIQGSGKSTFYCQNFLDSHLRISLDLLNTRNKEAQLLKWCLAFHQKLVIDNTNPLQSDRSRYIPYLRGMGYSIKGYYFDVDLNDALARNRRRKPNNQIPEKGISSTYNKLELPDYKEGFNELFLVKPAEYNMFEVSEFYREY